MAIEPVALMQCLYSDLYEQGLYVREGGEILPWMTLRQAAAQSLVNSFLKKLRVENTSDTDGRALAKFLACNDACGNWSLDTSKLDVKLEAIIGTVRQSLDDFWHREGFALCDHDYDVFSKGAVGPGVGIGSSGNDFYSKFFSSTLTVSDRFLYDSYKRYIWNLPEWSIAEQIRELNYGEPIIATSSRLSFVPKNDEISRCICVEPILNSFAQLGLGRILEDRLRERFGISLSSQPFKNRALARLGSITDGLATLDLSSASDSISLSMCRYLLPRTFVRMLERYRSRSVDIKGRGTVPLNMISTMGNGYTFPLQTIIFSAVVTACMAWRGIPTGSGSSMNGAYWPPRKTWSARASELWSVFGDDIICPSACAEDVVAILALLGFNVNRDKSFVKGPFRESCGSDFFNGSDIRGVYVKTLKTPEARYSVINMLARFSTKTGVDVRKTLKLLINSVDSLFVPPYEDFSAGIHVPSSLTSGLKYDRNLFSRTYLARIPIAKKVLVKGGRVVVPRRSKPLIYNPSGLLISLLQGSVKSESIGVRYDPVKYRTKRRPAPSWEPRDKPGYESQDYGLDWGRWQTVLESVLKKD